MRGKFIKFILVLTAVVLALPLISAALAISPTSAQGARSFSLTQCDRIAAHPTLTAAMKLVEVECNFEGNKTTFFFTSDGRVDFRELVKDLAGIFRNRIELRQIGVRDEAKMLGGLGICGRPYCCSQFMDDFQPVSTKMAKVQNLSLNPTKISGSCGRLMCCLRYEQAAYEDIIKKMPKLGAFVETPAGYGIVTQINLLREQIKVKLDSDGDNVFHVYESDAVATVPGGRPKDGETPPSVLHYVPKPKEPDEEPPADEWAAPQMFAQPMLPTLSRLTVKHTVSSPSRAAASAASMPAWPAPITAISHCPASYGMNIVLLKSHSIESASRPPP